VADEDRVVVVPRDRAEEVLKKAQEIDDRERGGSHLSGGTNRCRRRLRRLIGFEARNAPNGRIYGAVSLFPFVPYPFLLPLYFPNLQKVNF